LPAVASRRQGGDAPERLAARLIEHHDRLVVSVTLSFRAGGITIRRARRGVRSRGGAALQRYGQPRRGADRHHDRRRGGTLSASSGDDFLTISADALSDQAELVFDLLGDVTLHATFPESELELARTRALSALALQLSQPAAVAQTVLRERDLRPQPLRPEPDPRRAIAPSPATT